jgi:DNA-binding MarR family transcriptional regulator
MSPNRASRPVELVSDVIRLEIVLWERIDACLRERHELPLAFFESLHFISRTPGGGARVGDLARALRITVGGTSKLVDRIERVGLIERQPDPDDRRAARLALTPIGRRKHSAALKTYETEAAAILDAALSPKEQENMREHIIRLLTEADAGVVSS